VSPVSCAVNVVARAENPLTWYRGAISPVDVDTQVASSARGRKNETSRWARGRYASPTAALIIDAVLVSVSRPYMTWTENTVRIPHKNV
jgi:hypothetical protein